MSDRNQALDEAIRAVFAEEDDDLIVGWPLIVACAPDMDGGANYRTAATPGMPYHAHLGLAHANVQFVTANDADEEDE